MTSFSAHLAAEALKDDRSGTFDMDDRPEIAAPACDPRLASALRWLDENVVAPWRVEDRLALRRQSLHRSLARLAIAAGTISLAVTIVQLAIAASPPPHASLFAIEAGAFVAALIAVIIGLFAGLHHGWLGHRHRAERMRGLKFRALLKLLSLPDAQWRPWVADQARAIPAANDFRRIDRWAAEQEVESPAQPAPLPDLAPQFVSALFDLYLVKRVDAQASYFRTARARFEQQTRWWRPRALPLFLLGVGFVSLHFAADWIASRSADETARVFLEQLSLWCAAFAALLPVLAAGGRTLIGAFEAPRSASLFGAKYNSLIRERKQLVANAANISALQHHIAQIELFLENEHREWLRLLRETEWYI